MPPQTSKCSGQCSFTVRVFDPKIGTALDWALCHNLSLMILDHFASETNALFVNLSSFLLAKQSKQSPWPARYILKHSAYLSSPGRTSSNVSIYVFTGLDYSEKSTSRRARKGHLTRTAKVKPERHGTSYSEGRPPWAPLCDGVSLSGRVASMLYRVGQLYRTVMIAGRGGDFGPP
jgi:hypothetical protein